MVHEDDTKPVVDQEKRDDLQRTGLNVSVESGNKRTEVGRFGPVGSEPGSRTVHLTVSVSYSSDFRRGYRVGCLRDVSRFFPSSDPS